MLCAPSIITLGLVSLASAAPMARRAVGGPGVVPLQSAGNYVLLAQSAIATVPTSSITGNIGLSPAAASFITGLSLSHASGSPSATSSSVTGLVYASDYAAPTPSNLATAIGDSNVAYNYATGLTNPDFLNLGAGEIGGLTLAPGLYKWTTNVQASTDVTISGLATDTWIFSIAGSLDVANGRKITLAGGALARNIFWATGSSVTIGTTAHMEGVVSSKTSTSLLTGASLNGRIYAQTQATLQKATLVAPAVLLTCPILHLVILGIVICL